MTITQKVHLGDRFQLAASIKKSQVDEWRNLPFIHLTIFIILINQ